MVVSGLEWVAIAALIVVVLVFGAKKIPELARALGRSKKEFKEGAKES